MSVESFGISQQTKLTELSHALKSQGNFKLNVDKKINKLCQRILDTEPNHENCSKIEKAFTSLNNNSATPHTTSLVRNMHEKWKVGLAAHSLSKGHEDQHVKDIFPTHLHASIFKNNSEKTESLFQQAALHNPELILEENSFGKSPLHYAIENKSYGAIIQTLSNGIEVSQEDMASIFHMILSDSKPENAPEREALMPWINHLVDASIEKDSFSISAHALNTYKAISYEMQDLNNTEKSSGLRHNALKNIQHLAKSLPDNSSESFLKVINSENKALIHKGELFEKLLGLLKSGNNENLQNDEQLALMDLLSFGLLGLTENNDNTAFVELVLLAVNDVWAKSSQVDRKSEAIKAFLLDKVVDINLNEIQSNATFIPLQMQALLEACRTVLDTIQKNPNKSEIEKEFLNDQEFIPKLCRSFLCYNTMIHREDTELAAHDIIKLISLENPPFPILVYTGIVGHAMSISVEPNPNGTSRVTLHNTGIGAVKYHNKLPDSNKVETSLVFDEVPTADLQEHDIWNAILQCKNQHDIDKTYETFGYLVRNGVRSRTCGAQLAAESPQVNSSCAAQHALAFMRHEFLSNFISQSDDLGKLGCYKFFKNSLLIEIGEKNIQNVDPSLLKLAQAKIDLHKADIAFAKTIEAEDGMSAATTYAIKRRDARDGEFEGEFSRLGREDKERLNKEASEAVDFMLVNKNSDDFGVWFLKTWRNVPVRKEMLDHALEKLSEFEESEREDHLQAIVFTLQNSDSLGENRIEEFVEDLAILGKQEAFEHLL